MPPNHIMLAHWHKSMIVGVNGQGKSVLFRALVRDYLEAGAKVLLYDSEHEVSEKIPRRKGVDPEAYLDSLRERHPRLYVYVPRHSTKKARIDEFDQICAKVFESGRLVLAVESIDFYAPPRQDLSENLQKIVHWGRNEDIGLIMTSRRPANVNKDACALNQNWFLFHCYINNDLKWLREFVPEHHVEELKTLPRYGFIHWTQDTVQRHSPIPEEEAEL